MKGYSAPLFIDFDVTLACNLGCAHCNVSGGDPLQNEFSLQEIKAALDEMSDIGVHYLAITGGEPLMRKDWREIVAHANEKPAWKLNLNTNGILWTEDDVKFMAENGGHVLVAVSCDGYSPETYSTLRRTLTNRPAAKEFEKVVQTIKMLVDYDQKAGMNFTITKTTIDNFFKAADLARTLGVSILGLKFFPYGRGLQNFNELELDYKTWSTFLRKLTVLKEENPDYDHVAISITCPWEMYVPLMSNGYAEEDVTRIWGYETPLKNEYYRSIRSLGCNAGVTSCAISSDGSVFPCGTVSAKIPAVYCGNIREGGLLHVWENSPFFDKIRELDISQVEGHCTDCEFKELCGGGCRARAVVHGGGLHSCDPLCPFNQ